jgi:hypothetical protein
MQSAKFIHLSLCSPFISFQVVSLFAMMRIDQCNICWQQTHPMLDQYQCCYNTKHALVTPYCFKKEPSLIIHVQCMQKSLRNVLSQVAKKDPMV